MTTSTVFTAHDVPDLLGALPTRFGFMPEESICAIATHGPRHRFGFSMRMDLPDAIHLEAAGDVVAQHLAQQGAEGAIIVGVSEHTDLVGRAVWAVENALGEVAPVVSAWADGERYWTTFDDCDPAGYPYQRSDHHLAVVQAIAEGQEILPSRAALESRFEPVSGVRADWLDAAVEDVIMQIVSRINTESGGDVGALGCSEVEPIVERGLAGRRLDDGDVLRLAVWVSSLPVRDAAWMRIDRSNARDMLRVWTQVARHAPSPFEPGPLCLAGFAAYMLGDGAQALIALERAQRLDPEYLLAGILIDVLQRGISPVTWEELERSGPQRPPRP